MESFSENKKLKNGFTTGSAATAATKAALIMLITGKSIDRVRIVTPVGIEYKPEIINATISEYFASSGIIKDSGDDPDVTNGLEIVSKVRFADEDGVFITGGEGVGIVTRPGLDQGVSEYAINSTPRKMICNAVYEVLDDYGINRGVKVEISVPKGREIAEKTFNPHMGIEGGISIIGTTGIVEPMSTRALVDTIKLDIKMQFSEGKNRCIIVPGNYGVTFLKNNYNIDEKDIVLCSNYVGDSIKMAVDVGFKDILFCSHIGKLIKVSGGYMNTHSSYGDHRMELMCRAYKEACLKNEKEASEEMVNYIMDCVSTTAALDAISKIGMVKEVSDEIVNKALFYLKEAADNKAKIECIMYENSYGELAGNIA